MRKRELLVLFVSIMLLLASAVCWLIPPPSPTSRINRKNFDMIRAGMNEEEVDAILGGPEGDYSTGEVEPVDGFILLDTTFGVLPSRWQGDEANVCVSFDEKGKVLGTLLSRTRLKSPPFREKIRRWIGFARNESGGE